ncbi:PTS system mannitol-specific IIC component [Pullulanibacillus pueri]|uniref:PTS system mannitol-specific EIICB component n=1 Tax=Pullulanibacillus pueri TaxID=1437324 RepID=A0A8J2ZXN5_9BACL|nr:PTS mannitol-specific transporter subunit IIBC [Pullulanibacillus pueri]MBM7682930.1 PTS system mannitol-specific IIC component [Pullulanibacillus pueri]GGH84755.1 PTS system mannitol-specific EIICB component [Pullulanibacillus pueri]
MTTVSENASNSGSVRVKIQRFGSFLSGMIMPNIGAFIAWGLITAFFIPTGWIPNKHLAELVDPMIKYLLPLLIGYTGGKIVHDVRGGVVGAVATMGVIVGSDVPMFLGAMIMGPLGGYLIKQVDNKLFKDRIPQGFEMLVNNFSAGILGGALAIIAYFLIGPAVQGLSNVLADGVDFLVHHHLIPLANIFIEPAKVLFLNNAIGNGILVPLGVDQSKDVGKSILFLLESNPGPGLGMLLAYWAFAKGSAKQSAPGAIIIQFLGGIHEIYFPYVLMKPMLIFAVMAGGVCGTLTFSLFNAGLTAAASPGSIFALLAMTPRGVMNYIGVIAGVLVAAAVSFILSSLIIKTSKDKGESDDLSAATEKMEQMKGKKSSVASSLTGGTQKTTALTAENVDKIVFACDAGMGSSAMGASILRKKVKEAGLDIEVTNTSINNLPSDADVVVTHKDLTDRAKVKLPEATHISVENFLGSPKYDELIADLKGEGELTEEIPEASADEDHYDNVHKIIFACDAGMGSSAMGASILRKKVKAAGLDIEVSNTSINNLPSDADIVVTHRDLTDRAKVKLPNATHVSVDNFLGSPKYDELIEKLK